MKTSKTKTLKSLSLLVAIFISSFRSLFGYVNSPPNYATYQQSDYLIYSILIGLLIGGVSILFSYLYFQKKHRQKLDKLRVKISSDLHDDVGSILAALAMQAELLEMKASATNKARAGRIAEMGRDAMALMRDTVWAIDARKDRWESLVDRLNEYAYDTLSARDIQFDLQVDGLNMQEYIDPAFRQSLYLIGKEAITNIIRHSNATQVTMKLNQSRTGFEMRIQDNGAMPEKNNKKPSGLGLSNMLMRAKHIGGQLNIISNQGFGISLHLAA